MPKKTQYRDKGSSNVENLKVILMGLDISPIVKKVNITEGIYQPFIKGHVEFSDSGGFIETYKKARLEMMYDGLILSDVVEISFTYLGKEYNHVFQFDGFHNMETMHGNNYKKTTGTMTLQSIQSVSNAVNRVTEAYNGTSVEVIKQIYHKITTLEDSYDLNYGADDIYYFSKHKDPLAKFNKKINSDTIAGTSGSYIGTNISPMAAIGEILKNTFEADTNSPIFIWESFYKKFTGGILNKNHNPHMGGHPSEIVDNYTNETFSTQLKSFNEMKSKQIVFDVSPVLPNMEEKIMWGNPQQVIVRKDHANELNKIYRGVLGQEICLVDLSKTSFKTEYWEELKKLRKVDPDSVGYDDHIQRLAREGEPPPMSTASIHTVPYLDFEDEQFLITNKHYLNIAETNAIRDRMNTVVIEAYRNQAMPGLESGDNVTFLNKNYTVSQITHRLFNGTEYEQDLTIINEGLYSG
jgi:hypothetical protein